MKPCAALVLHAICSESAIVGEMQRRLPQAFRTWDLCRTSAKSYRSGLLKGMRLYDMLAAALLQGLSNSKSSIEWQTRSQFPVRYIVYFCSFPTRLIDLCRPCLGKTIITLQPILFSSNPLRSAGSQTVKSGRIAGLCEGLQLRSLLMTICIH